MPLTEAACSPFGASGVSVGVVDGIWVVVFFAGVSAIVKGKSIAGATNVSPQKYFQSFGLLLFEGLNPQELGNGADANLSIVLPVFVPAIFL
jgi:hypothetical protein